MFCGREVEIRAIERALIQTKNGNPQNFIIQGERGIGKSSLLSYAENLASPSNGSHNFLVVSFELESHFNFLDIISKMIAEVKIQLKQVDKIKGLFNTVLKIASQIESDIFRLKKEEVELYSAVADIANLLKGIIDSGKVEGILILMDEADRPRQDSNLGSFLKLLTERLTKINCNKVCIGLFGLDAIMGKLRDSHESSLRLFNVLNLKTLEDADRIRL